MSVRGPIHSGYDTILTPEAVEFLVELHRRFDSTRQDLLKRRRYLTEQISQGNFPAFLPETRGIREGSWKCASTPADLLDRRVEITGKLAIYLFAFF
jgi:malate synthase